MLLPAIAASPHSPESVPGVFSPPPQPIKYSEIPGSLVSNPSRQPYLHLKTDVNSAFPHHHRTKVPSPIYSCFPCSLKLPLQFPNIPNPNSLPPLSGNNRSPSHNPPFPSSVAIPWKYSPQPRYWRKQPPFPTDTRIHPVDI